MRRQPSQQPSSSAASSSVRDRLQQRLQRPTAGGVAVEILVPGQGPGRGRRAFSGIDEDAPAVGLGTHALEAKLRAGRSTGALNLSCLGLAAVPKEALSPYDHLGPEEKAWEVVELQKVDLSMNELSQLPSDVANWAPALRVLLCRQNALAALPRELFSLASLVNLDLSSNRLSTFGDGPALLDGLPALREINLRANQLVALPASLGALSALECLDVSYNKLAALPSSVGQLGRLQTLVASQNAIEALPPSLLSLPALRLLDLRKNRLAEEADGRPLDLSRLRSLTHLDLRENRLGFAPLPPNLLSQLYLGNNKIRRLPARSASWFAPLASSLTELDLQGNALEELPIEVALCQKLKLLDLTNNDLRDIPFTLGYVDAVNRVLIEGNPLRTLRRTLFTAPISELKKYLRTRGDPPAWLLAAEDGKDALALAADMEGAVAGKPAAAAGAAGWISLEEDQLKRGAGPPLPCVSNFSAPSTMPFAPPPPAAPCAPPPASRAPSPPQAPAPAQQSQAQQMGARAAEGTASQDTLDLEIRRLEEQLEALGITTTRKMVLKRELALKRAQRLRRGSVG